MSADEATGPRDRRLWVVLCVAAAVAACWLRYLDQYALEHANAGLVQVGVLFGTIRLLNAVVSMFQEVTINFLISRLAIGQLLDPMNDLVEYVSEGLKLALGSFLLQRIIIEVVATPLFKVIVTVAGAAFAGSLFVGPGALRQLLFKVFVSLLFARFAVGVGMVLTTLFSSAFLDSRIEAETERTQRLAGELDEARQASEELSESAAARMLEERGAVLEQISALEAQAQPLRQQRREHRYDISRLEQQIERLESGRGIIENLVETLPEVEALQAEIETLEARNDELDDELGAIGDQQRQLRNEVESIESHLYDDSTGVLSRMTGGVGAARDYILGLTNRLVDSVMTALVLFVFKMILLPILFLYLVFRGFRALWGRDIRSVPAGFRDEVRETLTPNREATAPDQRPGS